MVGMGSLMTQLGKCCKPAPPDPIGGFVTRGKGVSVHRLDCVNYRNMVRDTPERSIDVQWSADAASTADGAGYPVDLLLQTTNRPGLLRDITELFARDKMPVIGMQTEPGKGVSHMTLTVQVANTNHLRQTLAELCKIEGIVFARRRN